MSRPVWARGLKLSMLVTKNSLARSRPVWARGLKPSLLVGFCWYTTVAPRVGAWIETANWKSCPRVARVAPRVGAWIETSILHNVTIGNRSRPVWARGLKRWIDAFRSAECQSRPVWARGLKHHGGGKQYNPSVVAPRVGAWIETSWRPSLVKLRSSVAPRVGAWIETTNLDYRLEYRPSRPVWARGLKLGQDYQQYNRLLSRPVWARGLKQSRIVFDTSYRTVAPRVGAWIET